MQSFFKDKLNIMAKSPIQDLTNSSNELPDYEKDLPTGEEATHNSEIHKRIEDILEEKRLKALLDDTDDWDI